MGNAAPEAPRDPGAVPVSMESQLQHPSDLAASWSHLHGMILQLLADDAALERECDRMMPRRRQPVQQPARRRKGEEDSGGDSDDSDGSEGGGDSDKEGHMKPTVAARRQGAASDPKPLAGNRISPEELQRVTQCLIDRLGCRHPKTLERIGDVYASFAGREEGLTNHEFRGYVACILTQALRELEGRCSSAGVRVMSVTEARTAMGAPQAGPEHEEVRAAEHAHRAGPPQAPPGVASIGQGLVTGSQRPTDRSLRPTDGYSQGVAIGSQRSIHRDPRMAELRHPPDVPAHRPMHADHSRTASRDQGTMDTGVNAVALGVGRPSMEGNMATLHRQDLALQDRQLISHADAQSNCAVGMAGESCISDDGFATQATSPEPSPVLSELQIMMQDMDALTSSLAKGEVLPSGVLADILVNDGDKRSSEQKAEPIPKVAEVNLAQNDLNRDGDLAVLTSNLAALNSSLADAPTAPELPRIEPPLFAPASCTASLNSITSQLDALTASLKGGAPKQPQVQQAAQCAPQGLPQAFGPRAQVQCEILRHLGNPTTVATAQLSEGSRQRALRGENAGSVRGETGNEFLSVAPVLEKYPHGRMCLLPLNGPPPSPPASPRQIAEPGVLRQGHGRTAGAGSIPPNVVHRSEALHDVQADGAQVKAAMERPARPESLTAKDLGMTAYGTPSGEALPPQGMPCANGDGTIAAETAGKKIISSLKGAGGLVASGWTAFADGMEKIFVPEIIDGDGDWHAVERLDNKPAMSHGPQAAAQALLQPEAQSLGPEPARDASRVGPISAPCPAVAPYQGARDMGRADLHEFGRGRVPAPSPGSEPPMLLTMRDEPSDQQRARPEMSHLGVSHHGIPHPGMTGMPHDGGFSQQDIARQGTAHSDMPSTGWARQSIGLPAAQEGLMGQRAVADVPMLFRVPSPDEIHDLLQVDGLPAYVGGGQGFAAKRLCLDGHGETLYVLESDSSVPSIFFGMPGFPLRDLRRIVHGSAGQPGTPPLLSLEFEEGYLPVRLGDPVVMHGLLAALIQGRDDIEVVKK